MCFFHIHIHHKRLDNCKEKNRTAVIISVAEEEKEKRGSRSTDSHPFILLTLSPNKPFVVRVDVPFGCG